jgi:hypothetical protein
MDVFRETWGETFVGAASLGFASFCAWMPSRWDPSPVFGHRHAGDAAVRHGAILLMMFFSAMQGVYVRGALPLRTEGEGGVRLRIARPWPAHSSRSETERCAIHGHPRLGGTRFVGRHIVETLLDGGHRVSVLTRGKSPDELPASVERLRAIANREQQAWPRSAAASGTSAWMSAGIRRNRSGPARSLSAGALAATSSSAR